MSHIRPITAQDISALKAVLDSIELFPSSMLEEMSADYFNNPESQDIWLTAVENEKVVAIAYCAPETFTEGTFNLYAIGVHQNLQGKGVGKKMMAYLEQLLKDKGHRILLVETSGTDDFQLTRRFYEDHNYTKEAVIRDFWSEGDDKVVYWKKLN